MARDQRRLAAIVSADVAGYSRLMGQDESGTLAALKAHRRELIDPKIAEYGGRIVKTTGDGLLLEFPSVVEAVRCAVDVQRGMAERNAGVPPERRIEFRLGINVGDIILDGEDIYGDGVNVAARLQALAEPGHICVSKVVRDQVLDKLSFGFEELGAQQVKNIARPIEVYRVRDEGSGAPLAAARTRRAPALTGWPKLAAGLLALALIGAGSWQMWRLIRPVVPPAFSLALMPFSTATGDPEERRFANALTENILALMGKSKLLRIASARTVQEYQGKSDDPRSIGRALNVRYLVDGAVRIAKDEATITLQLTDCESATQIWSHRLTRNDLVSSEGQLAAAADVTNALKDALYEREERRAVAHPIPGSALDLYLQGAAAQRANIAGPATQRLAVRKFYDDALRIDPDFLPALNGLATLLNNVLTEDLDSDAATRAKRVDELDRITTRMVSIDGGYGIGWYDRAYALGWLGRFDQALEANTKARALEVYPVSLDLDQQGDILLFLNRPDEALALADRSASMFQPMNTGAEGWSHRLACESNLLLGRYAVAVAECEKSAANDDWWIDQVYLTALYAQLGDSARAAAAKSALLGKKPTFTIEKFKPTWSGTAGFNDRAEAHFYAGLRKAGIPDR